MIYQQRKADFRMVSGKREQRQEVASCGTVVPIQRIYFSFLNLLNTPPMERMNKTTLFRNLLF